MKACTHCPYPVAGKDAMDDPDAPGKVMHKVCPETPPTSPRRGKLHPAAMRLMRVSETTHVARQKLQELRGLVERGEMGSPRALDLAKSIEVLAVETTSIVKEAQRARED